MFREYATSSHHLRTEQDMHRKRIELEERIQQRLRDAEREREMEARKVFHFQGQLTVKSQKFSVREQILNFYMLPDQMIRGKLFEGVSICLCVWLPVCTSISKL